MRVSHKIFVAVRRAVMVVDTVDLDDESIADHKVDATDGDDRLLRPDRQAVGS